MKVKLLPNWNYIHAYRINNLNDIKSLAKVESKAFNKDEENIRAAGG